MDDDALKSATATLLSLGPQRVWSLLVTVFGDLAQEKGAAIDGPVLSALMSDLQIKPEATRVALHRLRNDNWIMSSKHGRTSRHSLTAHGRKQSNAASPRIYGLPQDAPQSWKMVILKGSTTPDRDQMATLGFIPLMPRVFVGCDAAIAPDGALVLSPDTVPQWIATQLEPRDLADEYAALFAALTTLEQSLPRDHSLAPHDIAVLRCVIVHSWRRLVLKHPQLPPQLYSEKWRGHDCRALVTTLLARLPRPDLGRITPI